MKRIVFIRHAKAEHLLSDISDKRDLYNYLTVIIFVDVTKPLGYYYKAEGGLLDIIL